MLVSDLLRRAAWLLLGWVLVSCGGALPMDSGPAPAVLVYDAARSTWTLTEPAAVEEGSELRIGDGLYRRVSGEDVHVGDATSSELARADQGWAGQAEVPSTWTWVRTVDGPVRHARVLELSPGERFAWRGRVFETQGSAEGGIGALRATGEVLHAVEGRQTRIAPLVLDAVILHGDGRETELTGTPEHPFWAPEEGAWVRLGELEPGTALRTRTGEVARLVSLTPREGAFAVHNLSVEGRHNYWVAESGGEPLLVHNACDVTGVASQGARKAPNTATYQLRNADGTFKQTSGGGEVVSGGTSPGKRLSFPEQQKVHTEGKILDATSGNTEAGDILTIQGREPVCNMCSGAMKKAADERQIKITYDDAAGGKFEADGR